MTRKNLVIFSDVLCYSWTQCYFHSSHGC